MGAGKKAARTYLRAARVLHSHSSLLQRKKVGLIFLVVLPPAGCGDCGSGGAEGRDDAGPGGGCEDSAGLGGNGCCDSSEHGESVCVCVVGCFE